MTDAIQEINLGTATEQLRATIQLEFIKLIPPEQWEQMIRTQLRDFMEGRTEPDQYSRYDKQIPPQWPIMARAVLSEVMEEQLRARLKDVDFFPKGQGVKDIILEWLEAHRESMTVTFVGTFVKSLFQTMADAATQNAWTHVQSSMQEHESARHG